MYKKNIVNLKSKEGNITIMMLILGLVIILTTTVMTRYIFRDITFTRLDEGKSRALNIAEAGVSDMFFKIEKHHEDDNNSLPSNPYTGNVIDSNNDVQGSFEISYDEVFNGDGKLTNYIISSVGTELDGYSREVEVNLAVNFSTEVNIFEYIYSKGSLTYDGILGLFDRSFISGPLFVGRDLTLRVLETVGDFSSGGKVLVGGTLDIGEFSRIKTELLSVGGNLEMSGWTAHIEDSTPSSTSDPLLLVVMGDIRMTGSTRIGTSSYPVDYNLQGIYLHDGSDRFYRNEPMTNDVFDPPNFNVNIYISNFINQINGPPVDYLEIMENEDGAADDVFKIDPDLLLVSPPYDEFYRSVGGNEFYFYEDSGQYYLEIKGNVLVDSDITIGEAIDQSNDDIRYEERGKLISTGKIDASCRLVPRVTADFPEDSLLILISHGDMDISVDDYNNYVADYNDPDVCIVGMSGGTIFLNSHNAVKGTLICNQIDADSGSGIVGWLVGSFTTIGYQEDLSDNIPDDMPPIVYGGATFSKEWQEVVED